MSSSELNETNMILMKLPLFQNIYNHNEELIEQVGMLKCNISYFENANRKLLKKIDKLKQEIKMLKKNKYRKCEDDADNDVTIDVVHIIPSEPAIKMVIEEDDFKPDDAPEKKYEKPKLSLQIPDEEIDENNNTESVVEEVEDEVEDVQEDEEEEAEENVTVVEDGKEEVVEVEEEEVVEVEDSEVVEVEEEEGDEEQEEDVYEIQIDGSTYYVSNEQNSVIYAADEDGEITIEAGIFKNGVPVFY